MLSAFIISVALVGCVSIGALSDPVSRELRSPPNSVEKTVNAIVRKMAEGGTVISVDKTDGYINGRTSMNVQVSIQVNKDGMIRIKGQLPSDKVIMGTVDSEMDKFVASLAEVVK